MKDFARELLNNGKQIVRCAKTHFEIDLRELGLAVGTQIFVAKAECAI